MDPCFTPATRFTKTWPFHFQFGDNQPACTIKRSSLSVSMVRIHNHLSVGISISINDPDATSEEYLKSKKHELLA
jgi:hypothetical protein